MVKKKKRPAQGTLVKVQLRQLSINLVGIHESKLCDIQKQRKGMNWLKSDLNLHSMFATTIIDFKCQDLFFTSLVYYVCKTLTNWGSLLAYA